MRIQLAYPQSIALLALLNACALDWSGQAEGAARRRDDARDGGALSERSLATVPRATRLPADPALWLAADRGVHLDADQRVTQWADQSGHERHAVSASPEQAPQLLNGDVRAPLVFDGDDQLMLPMMTGVSDLSFFAVAAAAEEERHCPSILHFSRSDDMVVQSVDLEFGRHSHELYYENDHMNVPQGMMYTNTFSIEQLHVLSVVHAPSGLAVTRIDGSEVHQRVMDLSQPLDRTWNFIGNNHYFLNGAPNCDGFKGQIAEILFYARGLADDDVASVERYLSETWSVPLDYVP